MKTLTVFEKYSRYWPAIAITSAIMSLTFFLVYWYSQNVLVAGYLRVTAFAFFALSLLSFFKWKDGRMKIDFTLDQDHFLRLNYFVRNRKVADDNFNLTEFSDIEINRMPIKTLYNEFATSDRCIRFKRYDTEGWSYLIEVHGRVIPIDKENAKLVLEFLNPHLNQEFD
ncbi:MAG: hypothetical protein WD599_01535 [Balneolaceae bacterium]